MEPEYHHKTIRKECIDEQNLVSHRMTWLLMTQAFLFTTFVISFANGAVKIFWWYTFIVVPFIGITVALAVEKSIKAAILTLNYWHQKEREFLNKNSSYQPLDRSGRGDEVHWISMRFPSIMPIFLVGIWLLISILGLAQSWLHFLPVLP